MSNFAEIVEEVKVLSTQQKRELHQLIEKYLIEERRKFIKAILLSLAELEDGQSEFSVV